MNIFAKIGISIGLAIASFFGFHQAVQQPLVGSTIPVTTAFYSDSIQSQIGPTATSFTLVKGSDSQGRSLSGTYGFVLDQGSASQEIVYCTTVSGVNVSGCIRGVDLTYGSTSVVALEQTHNRGASVQITTAPVVNIIANILRGVDSIPQSIYYDSSVSSTTLATNGKNVADVDLVNYVGSSGCANATEGTRGCVDLATGSQASNATSLGSSGARLVLPASIATSTCQSAANSVLVASSTTGQLDGNCLNTSYGYTFLGPEIFNGTTTIKASPSKNIILNGLGYSFPTARQASSTVLSENGSGSLSWESVPGAVSQDSGTYTTSQTSTTTLQTYVIPASTIGTNGTLSFLLYALGNGVNASKEAEIDFGNGVSTTTVGFTSLDGNQSNTYYSDGQIFGQIRNINSASSQVIESTGSWVHNTGSAFVQNSFYIATTSKINTAATYYISIGALAKNGSDSVTLEGFTLTKLP